MGERRIGWKTVEDDSFRDLVRVRGLGLGSLVVLRFLGDLFRLDLCLCVSVSRLVGCSEERRVFFEIAERLIVICVCCHVFGLVRSGVWTGVVYFSCLSSLNSRFLA
jgi:hypothetical protein